MKKNEPTLVEANATGIYICLTRDCPNKCKDEVEFPFNMDWPLAARQHKCRGCKKNLTLYRVKKVMTEEAKSKLITLAESRKLRKIQAGEAPKKRRKKK